MTIEGMAGGFWGCKRERERELEATCHSHVKTRWLYLHEDERGLANAKEEHPEQLQREHEQLEEGVDDEEWSWKPGDTQ